MLDLLFSLAVLAAFALIGAGAWAVVKRPEERKRGWLMVLAGLVTLINVAIWAVPVGPS